MLYVSEQHIFDQNKKTHESLLIKFSTYINLMNWFEKEISNIILKYVCEMNIWSSIWRYKCWENEWKIMWLKIRMLAEEGRVLNETTWRSIYIYFVHFIIRKLETTSSLFTGNSYNNSTGLQGNCFFLFAQRGMGIFLIKNLKKNII